MLTRFRGGRRQPDAAGLPAASSQDLGLDRRLAAEAPGDGLGLVRRGNHVTDRDGDAVAGQDVARLMFLEFHLIYPPLNCIVPRLEGLRSALVRRSPRRLRDRNPALTGCYFWEPILNPSCSVGARRTDRLEPP